MWTALSPQELGWCEASAHYLFCSWLVQATVVLGSGLLLARLPRLGPAQRHAVLAAALVLATLAPAALLCPLPFRATVGEGPSGIVPRSSLAAAVQPAPGELRAEGRVRPRKVVRGHPAARPTAPALAWARKYPLLTLAGVWLLLVLSRGLLLALSACQVSAWRRGGRCLDRERLYRACGYRLADLPVLETPGVGVPSVIGIRKPTILLPLGLAERVDDVTLGHILFHEEGHVRRRDPLFRLLAALAGLLLFWHPLAAVVRRQMEQAAEDACDLHVLRRGAVRTAYARTLLSILELALSAQPRSLACRLGRGGSELRRRIECILTHPTTAPPTAACLAAAALIPVVGASVLLEAGTRPLPATRDGSAKPASAISRWSTRGPGSRPALQGVSAGRGVPTPNARTFPQPFAAISPGESGRASLRAPVSTSGSAPAGRVLPPVIPGGPPGYLGISTQATLLAEARFQEPRGDHLTVFVLDISSSMAAYQAEARREILLRLEMLPPGDRFNVIAFNARVLPYASSPVSPTPGTLASVREWLASLPEETGTNLAAGLEHALAQEEVTSVVLFTDGPITRGVSAEPELLALLERANRFHARVLAVGPAGVQAGASRGVIDSFSEPASGRAQAIQRPAEAPIP